MVAGVPLGVIRESAIQLSISSFRNTPGTSDIVSRAAWFEHYLHTGRRIDAPAERPHHACREPECATPSGKIACHTCGESWPCSAERRKRSDA